MEKAVARPWPWGELPVDDHVDAVAVLPGMDLDPTELRAGHRAAGDLDVGGQADAQRHPLTRLAAPPLLGPQVVVAGRAECGLQRAEVVAAVVADASGHGGAHRTGQQVAPAHLGGVEADLGREQVDGPLHGGGGLGPARARYAPVGTELVTTDRTSQVTGDAVRPRRHHAGEAGQQGPEGRISAGILGDGQVVGLDGAVPPTSDGDLLVLGPPVHHGHMFSLRVSTQRTGRPQWRASQPSSTSSGWQEALAPNPPPTSGAMTRTWSASSAP